jgi:hypothetical protein
MSTIDRKKIMILKIIEIKIYLVIYIIYHKFIIINILIFKK